MNECRGEGVAGAACVLDRYLERWVFDGLGRVSHPGLFANVFELHRKRTFGPACHDAQLQFKDTAEFNRKISQRVRARFILLQLRFFEAKERGEVYQFCFV